MKKILIILTALCFFVNLHALEIRQIEPPNWWSGMQHDTLKLLVYGDDFRDWQPEIKAKNVKLLSIQRYPSTQYIGLTIKVKKSGDFTITFKHPRKDTYTTKYSILSRDMFKIRTIGPSDVVYLLMPDRFADGDEQNNIIEGHMDPVRPDHRWGRRGGDLRGVIDHLDYFEELGISALWMTPVYENNYINCYHGYTPTNAYAVDPFLGDLDTYRELVDKCHQRDIKIIQDHIVNHISPTHPLAIQPPAKDWLNGSLEAHDDCNYRIMDITDAYIAESKKKIPIEGWFAGYLADMNMANPDVVDYYIYHAIWWIETMHLDGIREDTYAYSDLDGLSRWAKELKREYPDLFIVGEIMDFDRTRLSYFFHAGSKNYLSSIADFGFSSEIYQLIAENKSIDQFYREIANDVIYRDPNMMLTFMDNHDMGRFYSAVDGDIQKYLNAFTMIFCMRGIPQVYYGNEIGMSGGHDPENRSEFPGGFDYSEHNAFEQSSRSHKENQIFKQIQLFTGLRKAYPKMFESEMRHDISNNIYLVSRKDPSSGHTMIMAYNAQNKTQNADYSRIVDGDYKDHTCIKKAINAEYAIHLKEKSIVVPPYETLVFMLK